MAISLSLYDVFSRLVPGGLFVMAYLYGFHEVWLRSQPFTGLATAQLLGLAFISYILGYVFDPLGNRWYRFFSKCGPQYRLAEKTAERMFQYYPNVAVDSKALHWAVWFAYLKRRNLPMAQEIERLNATHIMLRSLSLGMLFASFIFCIKVVTGTFVLAHVLLSLLGLWAAYILMQEAIKFRTWFYQAIYQSVFALTLTSKEMPITFQPVQLHSQKH